MFILLDAFMFEIMATNIGMISDIEDGSVLICMKCAQGVCYKNISCHYNSDHPSFCYLVWNQQNDTSRIIIGGCYNTADDSCGSTCIAHSPITPLNSFDANKKDGEILYNVNLSQDYFCCCNQTRCNNYFKISKSYQHKFKLR
ncbi:hypothetical protein HZS_7958 [Henneguya salminicola]|nr:hypothetical protein HZS_7958 [Henneguya salminicola]